MSDLSDLITAGSTVATALGGGIAFLWNKIERAERRLRAELEHCHKSRAVKLTVIELLWARLAQLTDPSDPTLRRAKRLLDAIREDREFGRLKGAMMDVRKPVFDAARSAKGAGLSQSDVKALDGALDKIGLSKPLVASDGIPDDYWPMLARIESGNRLYAKAPSSTGSGLYQFIRATWIGEGGQWGTDLTQPFGGLKPTAEEQTARARTFTEKNVSILRAKGVPINKASLYAAHFFGAGMAAKVLGADTTARADLIAGTAATSANPSILKGKTVGQFLTWLHGKTGEWAQ